MTNTTPVDPLVESGFVFDEAEYAENWGLAAIGASDAWHYGTGEGIVVAVLDTGVDFDHSDLNENMWVNAGEIAGDGIDNDGNGYVDDVHGILSNPWGSPGINDVHGHGTHVAGIIAAEANGQGTIGVAPGAEIMAVKVTNDESWFSQWTVAQGIDYAVENGANIVNISLGIMVSGGNPAQLLKPLIDAVGRAEDAGVIVVAAAGNYSASEALYPAILTEQFDNVISVAASDTNGGLASFSNYSISGTTVDVAAPGVGIASTIPDDAIANYSGTSMASPMVAGAAAALWSAMPDLGYRQVIDAIEGSVDLLNSLDRPISTNGILNLASAMDLIQTMTPETPPENQAPVLHLEIAGALIPENTPNAWHFKLADIVVTDDGVGANFIKLSGGDVEAFVVHDNGLYFRSDVTLDFETKSSYSVDISINDPNIGTGVEDTVTYTIDVMDVYEAPEPVLVGGAGDDSLFGGSADDVMTGESGNDTITGGRGKDTISGGQDDDTINGGQGHDTAVFADGAAQARFALDGNNIIVTSADGTDTVRNVEVFDFNGALSAVRTDDGDNQFDFTSGTSDGIARDIVIGGNGHDHINTGGSHDVAFGGAGNDSLFGNGGIDQLQGNDGDDFYGHFGSWWNSIIEDNGSGEDKVRLGNLKWGDQEGNTGQAWRVDVAGDDLHIVYEDQGGSGVFIENALVDSNGDGFLNASDEDVIETFRFDGNVDISLQSLLEAGGHTDIITVTNLVTNGSFEDSAFVGAHSAPDGWTMGGPANAGGLHKDANRASEGEQYVAMGGWTNATGMTLGQDIDLETGTLYTLAFDLAVRIGGHQGETGAVRVEMIDAAGSALDEVVTLTRSDGGLAFEFDFTATSDAMSLLFTHEDGEELDVDLDDVSLFAASNNDLLASDGSLFV